MDFNSKQKTKLLDYLRLYNEDPTVATFGTGMKEDYKKFDEKRLNVIPDLRENVKNFLDKKISLKEFRDQSDKYSRKYPYWGFKAFSGQMQLNQYTKNILDENKDKYLREAIALPVNHDDAKKKINKFSEYLQKTRDKSVSTKGLPWSYQNYLLSYFWEIQNHQLWIAHYRSLRSLFVTEEFNANLSNTNGEAYIEFLNLMNDIKTFFSDQGHKDKTNSYWFVEHVLWKHHKETESLKTTIENKGLVGTGTKRETLPTRKSDWLPLIVFDLVELAFNKPSKWSEENHLAPQKAFETKLAYVFTLLGYETKELGQGRGREPDGIAISSGVEDGDYAIIYDAKAREDKFCLGTSDREIYEYIKVKKSNLKRQRINKLYFTIISSNFDENDLSKIRDIYRTTSVPVTFLKAEDLLLILEAKLQNVEIDHSQLGSLFLDYGFLTRDKIIDDLGLK